MLAYAVIVALCLAGYAGLPWWTVLPGAAALALRGWWIRLWRLGEPDHERWSKKITAYFVTGIAVYAAFAAAAFGLGRAARWALG